MESDPNGLNPHSPGAKLDSGKIKAGLLLQFSHALLKVAEVATKGAEKYTIGGWQYVDNALPRYFNALNRHLLALGTERFDKDTGCEHLAQVAWNALACLQALKDCPDSDVSKLLTGESKPSTKYGGLQGHIVAVDESAKFDKEEYRKHLLEVWKRAEERLAKQPGPVATFDGLGTDSLHCSPPGAIQGTKPYPWKTPFSG